MVGSIGIVSSLLLSGCTSSGGGTATTGAVSQADIDKAMSTPSSITFWSWLPNVQREIKLFEQKYPKITVKYSNAGQGTPEYTKLRTVVKAGSGIPDVVQVEFQYIPSFVSALRDLTPYGGDKDMTAFFPDSVAKQVTYNGGVYGVPQDTAPMGNLYRQDILAQAGITKAPATWDEYQADAKLLRAQGNYISDLPANEGSQFLALLWQAGAKPFSFDGKKTVGINFESDAAKKVADYWTGMVKNDLVATAPDFNSDWFSAFASGKYAGWLAPSWGPDQIIGSVKSSSGDWRAAALPQWDPSNPASGNWGGSSLAVPKGSKNPIVAYEFAKFLNTDHASISEETTSDQSLYPAATWGLANPEWINQKVDFFGGQQVNQLFSGISKTVSPDWQWLPFMDYAYTEYATTAGKAFTNKTDIEQGLIAWQNDLRSYAKQQGYTVDTSYKG
ncbi:MAG: extracellular solute-binding protein [Actinomycetota bacterium]|nr:extracellular solute-binding protein [Actinomycetota bacterium]